MLALGIDAGASSADPGLSGVLRDGNLVRYGGVIISFCCRPSFLRGFRFPVVELPKFCSRGSTVRLDQAVDSSSLTQFLRADYEAEPALVPFESGRYPIRSSMLPPHGPGGGGGGIHRHYQGEEVGSARVGPGAFLFRSFARRCVLCVPACHCG